jgi:hypothetical protein
VHFVAIVRPGRASATLGTHGVRFVALTTRRAVSATKCTWVSHQRPHPGAPVTSYPPYSVGFFATPRATTAIEPKPTLAHPLNAAVHGAGALATLDPKLQLSRIDHRRSRNRTARRARHTITRRARHTITQRARPTTTRPIRARPRTAVPHCIAARPRTIPTVPAPHAIPASHSGSAPRTITPPRTLAPPPRGTTARAALPTWQLHFGPPLARVHQRARLTPRQRRLGRRQARPRDDQAHRGDHADRPRHVRPAHAAQHV